MKVAIPCITVVTESGTGWLIAAGRTSVENLSGRNGRQKP